TWFPSGNQVHQLRRTARTRLIARTKVTNLVPYGEPGSSAPTNGTNQGHRSDESHEPGSLRGTRFISSDERHEPGSSLGRKSRTWFPTGNQVHQLRRTARTRL